MTKRLSRAGMLSAGLIAAGAALQSTSALAGKEEDAFKNAGYSLCDARLVGLYWEMDVDVAIKNAGDKIIHGDKDTLDDAIALGRKANNSNLELCPAKEFYSDKEIDAFAKYWDLDRAEAETNISQKLIGGDKESIDLAIKEELG